jgi:hypothetical protein
MRIYYTYKWLRKDGTPYYVGKGKGRRAWTVHKRKNVSHYPPRGRVEIVMDNISEEEALTHEVWLIALYGRKSEGGLLINLSTGGQGPSNTTWRLTNETRNKMKEAQARRLPPSQETKDKIKKAKTGFSWGRHTKTTKEKQSKTQTENWKDNIERKQMVASKMIETNSKKQPCPQCGMLMNIGNLTKHIKGTRCKGK